MKRAIIIGQAPPQKVDDIPFKKTRLYQWLSQISISQYQAMDIFEFEALVNFFPGRVGKGDNKPSHEDIQNHIPTIIKKIQDIDLIIPVGKMAIEYILDVENIKMSEYIGNVYTCPIFKSGNIIKKVVPLPHPSGLNTWVFQKENALLLEKALNHIKNHLK